MIQVILYVIAIVLFAIGAFVHDGRVDLVALGLAFALAAYAWPVISHA